MTFIDLPATSSHREDQLGQSADEDQGVVLVQVPRAVRGDARPWTGSSHGMIRRTATAAMLHDGTRVRQRVPS
jgi:hypothetical protein